MTKIPGPKDYSHRSFVKRLLMITKILTFLLLINLSTVSAGGFAQTVTLQANNITLLNAMKTIKKQTGYPFFLKGKNLAEIRKNVDINQLPLKEALDRLMIDLPAEWVIEEGTIVIKPISSKATLVTSEEDNKVEMSIPPDKVISGRVTDESGNALQGVSVIVRGTSTGTTTDGNGRFSLTVEDNAKVLIFSIVGYVSIEREITGTTIDATLRKYESGLDEVVVTALGIKRDVRSLTYSSQSVGTKDITEARELNLVNSLQGKVSGLSINSGGTGLGSDSRIVLRGNRSISGDSQPLYVVDGVPLQGGISTLNPDDIMSINVLKGPNGAALYGSLAQNGVIIIETYSGKGAKPGTLNISLNHTTMTGKVMDFFEAQNLYGQGITGVFDKTSAESWGPEMDGRMVEQWSNDPALIGTEYPFLPQPSNYKGIFRRTYNTSTNLSAILSGEKTQTVFSYTRTDANGLLPNTSLGRHNVTVRMTNDLSKKLTLDSKVNFMLQSRNNPNTTGDELYLDPYRKLYKIPRNIRDEDMRTFSFLSQDGLELQNTWALGDALNNNPYWIANRALTFQKQERVIALISLKYDFNDNLSLMTRASYDGNNNSEERKIYADSYGSTYNFGYYSVNHQGDKLWNTDFLLSFKKDISNIYINANFGGSLQRREGIGSLSANTTQALLVRNFFALSNTLIPAASFVPSIESETQSLYFSGNINWKRAIYLDITGRNDWSSTLPANSRSYFYPSVGMSVILSDLMRTPDWLNYVKVRASWASVGNSASPYMLSRNVNFTAGGNNGYLQLSNTLPNSTLKPEKTKSTEIGMNFHFFESRIVLDFAAYKTNTFNQLFLFTLPTGSGAANFYTNGGNVENRGLEVLLSLVPVKTKSFTWDISTNFSMNRNLVRKISSDQKRMVVASDPYMSDFVVEEEEEFGNIYSRGWQRDAQGNVIVGANGLPLTTSGKTVKVANFNPDWLGSISNIFSYKNISISVLIQHRQGGTMVSPVDAILDGIGVTQKTLAGREGGLIFGQNLFGKETAVLQDGSPNHISTDAQTFWRTEGGRSAPIGEAFVVSTTNTRIREVIIGYSLPELIMKTLPVSQIKFSLVGRNLFFIHRAPGNWDPEILTGTGTTSEGFQSFSSPSQRYFGVNLNIVF